MSTSSTIIRSSSIDSCEGAIRQRVKADREHGTERPIWGVLTQPVDSEERLSAFKDRHQSYIPASFMRWIESGGARVIPIRYDADEEELRHLFESINGVLLTGGEIADISNTPYGRAAKLLFEWAKEANDAGDNFPLYGTCQGFQLLCQLAAGNFNLKRRVQGCVGVSKPLEFTSRAKGSRMFGALPSHMYRYLGSNPSCEHMHNYCIAPESFLEHRGLYDMFEIIALNKDDHGTVFVSCIEGKRYPFWAGQFHPERNGWEWSEEEDIDHSPDAVVAMHHLAAHLVKESRKSSHRFKDRVEEQERLINSSRLMPTHKECRIYDYTYLWEREDKEERESVIQLQRQDAERPVAPSRLPSGWYAN